MFATASTSREEAVTHPEEDPQTASPDVTPPRSAPSSLPETPRRSPLAGMHTRSKGPAKVYDESVLGRQTPKAKLFDVEDIGPLAEQLTPILQKKEMTRQEALDIIGSSVEL